jgi:hypothetical protein
MWVLDLTRGGGCLSSIPGVITEDTVSFGDDVPALDIVEIGSIGVARLDVLPIELRS